MVESSENNQARKKISKIKTFLVPFSSEEIKENIFISSNKSTQTSQEEIIRQAINFHLLGNISEATKYYQKLIHQGCNDHRVFSNYAIILKDLGKSEEAVFSLRKAIEIKPDLAISHSNLGLILKDLDKLTEAELSLRKAIELKPDLAEAHSNLGNVLKFLGNVKDAETSYQKAIKLDPNFADAYVNLGCIQLLKGNYKSGLDYYEFRNKTKYNRPVFPHANPKLKRIDHEKLKQGEKLLVVSEQAPGDIIFHMRYLLPLKRQGIDLSFCAPKKLHSLIKDSGIHANPISPEECNLVKEGKWIPLLSLLRYFSISPDNPLINTPYISSTEKLKDKWRNILSNEKRPIIGINWQGNPKLEKSYPGRSISLETFSILLDKNDITMLSFQKGFGTEQMETCSFKENFVSCQEQINDIWDYSETAAIIESCDLIITNDCSIGPLAAGMGKKVWLLLKDIPYWTWGLKEENTFWYPSMRLFRQKERNNWQEVLERVSIAITKETKEKI